MTSSTESDPRRWLRAGFVGAPHGLDGSFYVVEPKPQLLHDGASLLLDGLPRAINRRAGTDRRPLIRLEGCEDREGAGALRGRELLIARTQAPELEVDEWWVDDLEGCQVRDGRLAVGTVRRVLALPSCEVLEVERAAGSTSLLVPLISDAVREVDVEGRRIEVDLAFLGET